MSTFEEGADVALAVPARGGLGFVNDADRVFLYRVLALHVRRGLRPSEAAGLVAGIFARGGEGTPSERQRRDLRKVGAERLASAFRKAEAGDEGMLGDLIEQAGLALSHEEMAAFALPYDAASAADVLGEAAAFLRELARP